MPWPVPTSCSRPWLWAIVVATVPGRCPAVSSSGSPSPAPWPTTPPLILADEPTANLDYIQAEGVVRLLRELRDDGRVIIVSTHDDRLVPVADRVVHMIPEFRTDGVAVHRVEYAGHESVFEQGSRGELVYVIEQGEVDIVRVHADGTEESLAVLGPGGTSASSARCSGSRGPPPPAPGRTSCSPPTAPRSPGAGPPRPAAGHRQPGARHRRSCPDGRAASGLIRRRNGRAPDGVPRVERRSPEVPVTRPLAVVVAVVLLVGAAVWLVTLARDPAPPRDPAVAQVLAWTPPADYTMDVQVSCFCPSGTFRVTVEDGERVDVEVLDAPGQAIGDVPLDLAPTMVEILDRLRETVDGEGEVRQLVVADDGHPEVVDLDPIPNAVDDEIGWTITSFTPAG